MATDQRTIEGAAQRIFAANVADSLSAALGALDRVAPYADRVARLLLWLAVAGAASSAIIGAVLIDGRRPLTGQEILVLGAVVLMLLAPALFLLVYRRAFLRFAGAGDRLRALAADIGGEAERMQRAVDDVRTVRRGDLRDAVGTLRALRGASRTFQERVDEFAPLVAAAAPSFLVSALLAALIVPIEVAVAVVVLGWTLLS